MTKEIMLTQGKVALVDDDDYEYINQWKWYAQRSDGLKGFYALRRGRNVRLVYMHRLVMNTPANMIVDHINHNTLDNRKENLRNVTSSQNNMNRSISTLNRTGSKGVSYIAWRKKFKAHIQKDYRVFFIGYFDTLEEASAAYQNKANELFGEHALHHHTRG